MRMRTVGTQLFSNRPARALAASEPLHPVKAFRGISGSTAAPRSQPAVAEAHPLFLKQKSALWDGAKISLAD